MVAITEIALRNFRGFAAQKLRLAPLTFLVGPNSSGKSSIADALLFMAQSGFLSLEATNPLWTGPLVDLGSFRDTVFRHDMHHAIGIHVLIDGIEVHRRARRGSVMPKEMSAEISVEVKTAKDAPDGRLSRLGIRDPAARTGAELVRRPGRHESFQAKGGDREESYLPRPWQSPAGLLRQLLDPQDGRRAVPPLVDLLAAPWLALFSSTVQRVSSGRDPPRRFYERGSNSAGEQQRRLLDGIDAAVLEAGRPHLRRRLIDGLSALGIASDLRVSRLGDYHSAVHLEDDRTGVSSNLADFGYGASQVIPVLEGCAAPGPGPLFVEQPEIHLHPRAQAQLAQILCETSLKRQMIVETHSEHMINRARLLVAEGKMRAEDVVVQYVDRDRDGSRGSLIGLDDAGNFSSDWPDGFYDERYQETMRIAEAQSRRAAE